MASKLSREECLDLLGYMIDQMPLQKDWDGVILDFIEEREALRGILESQDMDPAEREALTEELAQLDRKLDKAMQHRAEVKAGIENAAEKFMDGHCLTDEPPQEPPVA